MDYNKIGVFIARFQPLHKAHIYVIEKALKEFIEQKFDEIHAKYPDSQILYLAYSAITTCSYQSAIIKFAKCANL